MAGQDAVAPPEVLAGPILQRVTAATATVWMVTTFAIDPRKVRAEVWDPLPDALRGFISEPSAALGLSGAIDQPAHVEFRKAAPNVWVYRIRLTASRQGWPPNRALAYRIAPRGQDWLKPADGVEPLPGNRRPDPRSPGNTFEYPWFSVDPTERQWCVLSLAGESPPTWTEAERYLNRLCLGTPPARPPAINPARDNVPSGRPTTALLFQADAVPQDFETLERLKWELGRAFSSADLGSHFLSLCLAVSPGLWDYAQAAPPSGVTPPSQLPPNPLTRAATVALSKIAAHVPLYGLPSALFQITGAVEKWVATEAFGSCFLWGNQDEDWVAPAVPEADEDTAYSAGEPPHVRVLFSVPGQIDAPIQTLGSNRVFPAVVVAAPSPVLPLVPPAGFNPPRLGALDNVFALSADTFSSLNVPAKQIDEKAHMTGPERAAFVAQPWAPGGGPAHRIYQLAIASGTASSPPRSRRSGKQRLWNPRTSSYADGAAADMLQASPAFSVLVSAAVADGGVSWPGYGLAFFTDADHGRSVSLTRVSHRVIPQAVADVFLGNRFRTIDHQDDDRHLAGIEVWINGQRRAVTDAAGRATGLQAFLSRQPDGVYTLSIEGTITQDDPPDPSTTRPTGGDRRWRRREFRLVVRAGQIIQVDDEQVVSPGVRILVDPVYMRWVQGFSRPLGVLAAIKTRAANAVEIVIVHRTDSTDTLGTIGTWLSAPPPGARFTVGAAYILARDGTLIKGADDTEVMNHAPGNWQTAPATILHTNASGVGIEISKLDDATPYSQAQYDTLLWLLWKYVTSANPVNPLNIVGHSDVEPEGRDDPGLAFEWSQLEAQGFGLLRDPNALVSPLPAFPTAQVNVTRAGNQEVRAPTQAFIQSINADVAAFPTLFQPELNHPTQALRDAAVDQRVKQLLEDIGFHQNDFTTELLAFRSHFFSGARRMYFAFLPNAVSRPAGPSNPFVIKEIELRRLENAPFNMRALTAAWALKVHDYVMAQRAAASPARPQPQRVPPAPR
jgi:N-acetylmuramoyl-L-alanine amidase